MKKKWLLPMLFILIILAWMYANHKEVENGYFPDTEKGQIDEMLNYHADKGFATVEKGYVIIKKQDPNSL